MNIEKEQAMNAVEREIEDSSLFDKLNMEEELKSKLAQEKEELNLKISKARNDMEKKRLIKESKKKEKKIKEELQNERLRQERMLEEKKMNRQSLRKVKELEIEMKH